MQSARVHKQGPKHSSERLLGALYRDEVAGLNDMLFGCLRDFPGADELDRVRNAELLEQFGNDGAIDVLNASADETRSDYAAHRSQYVAHGTSRVSRLDRHGHLEGRLVGGVLCDRTKAAPGELHIRSKNIGQWKSHDEQIRPQRKV